MRVDSPVLAAPTDAELRAAEAGLLRHPSRAARIAEAALNARPDDARAAHLLGEALNRLGDAGAAAALLRRAVALDGRLAELSGHGEVDAGPLSWIGRFDAVACPLCGSVDGDTVWAGNLSRQNPCAGLLDPVRSWRRCGGCALVHVERPVPAAAQAAWRRTLPCPAAASPPTSLEFAAALRREDEVINRIRNEGYGLDWCQRSPAQPTLLEVGSGWGSLLAAARWRGFSVVGLDEDPAKVAWVQAQLAVENHVGCLSQGLPEGPFDVIVFNPPLDQRDNPMADLLALEEQLCPDGLLVLAVPSLDHPVHLLQGTDDPLWSAVERRVWFDRETLALLMMRCGLMPVHAEHDRDLPGVMRVYARRCPDADPDFDQP